MTNITEQMIFKRKIYDKLLNWKEEDNGRVAILVEGARRIGKSTIVEEFARNEYESYVKIDFTNVSSRVNELFDDISHLDDFFTRIQFEYGVRLVPRHSVIIFDEVQFNPKARQAIKHLVADRRFDYIETGSLISIRKNVENILIPSEERTIKMYPMDYEEFSWALGDMVTCDLLREALGNVRSIGGVHRKLMRDFRLYMLVGGMPQAVNAYLQTLDLSKVDEVKRDIINLYEADFAKIAKSGQLGRLFDNIPAQLSQNKSRYITSSILAGTKAAREDELISELAASMTVNLCHHTMNPANGLAMDYDKDYFKMYVCDTGLFVTLAFRDHDFTDNLIYGKLLSDKLSANLGYVYENVAAQILTACGKKLFYYTFPTLTSRHLYEVDFLVSEGDKIDPLEIKSSSYKIHKSLDEFCAKFSQKVRSPYVIYTKDIAKDGNITYLPIYMLPFLMERIR